MKRVVKDYFSFSKKERTAVIILLLLACAFTALPYFFSVKEEKPVIDPALVAFIRDNQPSAVPGGNEEAHHFNGIREHEVPVPAVLFRFDPNTLPVEGWVRLGITPKTAATIIKYRSKGGAFRSPQDIRKIWGLPKTLADKLVPFVVIAGSGTGGLYPKESRSNDRANSRFTNNPSVIDINTATPDEWKALPGIGDVLANRIVSYRERTGGFSGIMQVKKVYGISDSVFTLLQPFLKADMINMPKLDLNTVNPYLLAERTGITLVAAKGIVVYRQQYGRFKAIEDLRKIIFINDSLYNLLYPRIMIRPE